MEELVEERKKLCSSSFFARVMGYTYSWVNRAEHGKVKCSARFWRNYAESLEKVKELLKK